MAKFESTCTINLDTALEELRKIYEVSLGGIVEEEELQAGELLSSSLEIDMSKKGWIGLGNGGYMRANIEKR